MLSRRETLKGIAAFAGLAMLPSFSVASTAQEYKYDVLIQMNGKERLLKDCLGFTYTITEHVRDYLDLNEWHRFIDFPPEVSVSIKVKDYNKLMTQMNGVIVENPTYHPTYHPNNQNMANITIYQNQKYSIVIKDVKLSSLEQHEDKSGTISFLGYQ